MQEIRESKSFDSSSESSKSSGHRCKVDAYCKSVPLKEIIEGVTRSLHEINFFSHEGKLRGLILGLLENPVSQMKEQEKHSKEYQARPLSQKILGPSGQKFTGAKVYEVRKRR